MDSAREYAFAGFTLNLQRGVLRDGSGAVDLRPKAFHLLACLVTNAGRVMPKEELLDTIWPDVTVSEDSLTQCIGELRRALGKAASAIRTVPRRGYVFEEAALEAAPAATAAEPPAAAAIGRPSIAVMPFRNLSSDPEQEFFTDGLTEDIITDLSNVPSFFVIARDSTFAYKDKPTNVREIAQVLGVKYILEGSARRSAQRLRINVQLIDAAGGGNHVWAERFDNDLADIFVVQDEIARRVVEAITGKLAAFPVVERYRPSNIEAYDLCIRARTLWAQNKASTHIVQSFLEHAIALDPGYCEAHWRLAMALVHNWLHWGEPEKPNRPNAIAHAQRAVELDPNDSGAHWALGFVLSYERRWDEAEAHCETAIRLNPNNADALAMLADFKPLIGEPQQGVQCAERALRLNPHPPHWYYWNLGFAQFANGQYEDAARTLRREETYRTASRRILAAALAALGRVPEAQEEAKLFLSTSPHWRISKWIESQPFKNPDDAQRWFDAYRLAGLPE
ncbi:MAG: winged helix-turn-helix domain-containing protein [Aestuariivirga sp.]|nr:winged helix-turn-helix domain-containing protein [Aestuariivirga sp.]